VIYPGLLEHERLLERESQGIPLPAVVADELRELAQQMDLPLQLQEETIDTAVSEGE
jgi:LDH2 family malate/lactate/ureidoglycolate dehydrogenase